MQSAFINTAAATGPQFDSPPIAAAPQMAPPAPFSQLLIQAQAAPIPAPPPPPPSPPPAPPKANNTPPTNGGPNNSPSRASSTNQSNDHDSTSNAASSNSNNNSSDANRQTPGAAGKTPAEPRPKPDGKGSRAANAGDDSASQQTTAQSSAENAATAATVLSSQTGKKGDTGKDQKGDAKTGDANSDDASQSSGDASATTPDAGAQAAAAAVSAIATATTPVQDNQTGKAKTDAKQTAKPAATPAIAKNLTGASLLPAATQQGAGGALPADATAAATDAQSHTKNDATQTGSLPTTKNAPSIASQNNGPPTPSDVPVNVATAANAMTTVAISDAPVVSTTTADASTTAATSPSAENAPPPAAATPNYAAQNNALSTTPSAFAATMTQAGAAANAAGGGANAIDRARFVQRVASAFQSAGDQGGQIRLRLSPPELGSLQMQISVKQGVLSATIQADNSTAQQALLDSLPDLRDRLAQQDIRIDRFDVELMGQGSGGMTQPQRNPDFNQSGRQPPAVRNTNTAPTESSRAPVNLAVATNGALNIVV